MITPEQQGHGRTADADRPITYEQMADDTAALLRHLDAAPADVVGFSMGGGIALQLAIRHPDVVRRLVVISAPYTHDGMQPEAIAMFPTITPELFAGSPVEQAYRELAPDPGDFPVLVAQAVALDSTPYGWPADDMRAIPAPTLIVVGDADLVRLEHAVEHVPAARRRRDGRHGELPASRLAVLPGTSHFVPPGSGVLDRDGAAARDGRPVSSGGGRRPALKVSGMADQPHITAEDLRTALGAGAGKGARRSRSVLPGAPEPPGWDWDTGRTEEVAALDETVSRQRDEIERLRRDRGELEAEVRRAARGARRARPRAVRAPARRHRGAARARAAGVAATPGRAG